MTGPNFGWYSDVYKKPLCRTRRRDYLADHLFETGVYRTILQMILVRVFQVPCLWKQHTRQRHDVGGVVAVFGPLHLTTIKSRFRVPGDGRSVVLSTHDPRTLCLTDTANRTGN